tara:strand:+ start:1063 stop:1674 length:612 start_codon:yes stop_codon:yes gene_type:complete
MYNIFFDKVNDLPFIWVRDLYNKDQLTDIFEELDFLLGIERYKDPEHPDGPETAYDPEGNVLKHGKGVYLDRAYKDRDMSIILKHNRILFDKEFTTELAKYHPLFRFVEKCTGDNTKIHYFVDGDYYKPHVDGCTVSAVTWFHKKPKAYTGGDIILEHKYKLPCLNNSMVIFPSIMWHEVTKVVMPNNEYGMGRYSMSQFLTL